MTVGLQSFMLLAKKEYNNTDISHTVSTPKPGPKTPAAETSVDKCEVANC